MINFERTEVWGFEHALRGMRNPMNSWNKSDSRYCTENDYCDECILNICNSCDSYLIGENDMNLARKLVRGGSEHRKFMRQIYVSVDITAPLYWWKEFDTYKVGTVSNSCSTMHKIHAKEFELDDFSFEHLRSDGLLCDSVKALKHTINILNFWRERYNASDSERQDYFKYNGYPETPSKSDCWWQMIQLLPSSYNQKRTLTLNYENLYAMYRQRKNHKLDEWSVGFINWLESLPYAKELIICEEN